MSEDGGPIEIGQVADYLEISKKSAYQRIKKSKKFEASDGMICSKENKIDLE